MKRVLPAFLCLFLVVAGGARAQNSEGRWYTIDEDWSFELQERELYIAGYESGLEYRVYNKTDDDFCFEMRLVNRENVKYLLRNDGRTNVGSGEWVRLGGHQPADAYIGSDGTPYYSTWGADLRYRPVSGWC